MLVRVTKQMLRDEIDDRRDILYIKERQNCRIMTGFKDIDYLTKGLHRGQTYLISGRPSMGKTSFVLNIVNNINREKLHSIAYFSADTCGEDIMVRLLQISSWLNVNICDVNNANENTERIVDMMMEEIDDAFMYVSDDFDSVEQIEQQCNEIGNEIDVVIVDSIDSLAGDFHKNKRKAKICKALKTLAMKLNCVVIMTASVKRSVEKRNDHRPNIADIRINNVSEVVDNIIILYREEYYDNLTSSKGIAEINIAQNKNGRQATVEMAHTKGLYRTVYPNPLKDSDVSM